MEAEKTQEQKPSIKELLDTFAGYSTLHGLHFLADASSYVRKLIWFLLLCSATAIFVYLAYWGWTKWRKYEVFVTTEIKINDVSSLPFPAVTICNKNMMKRSRIRGTDSQRYLDALDNMRSYKKYSQMMNSSFNIEQAVLENGHQLKDMVKGCFGPEPCGEFDHFFDTLSGLCYTFNGNGSFKLKKKGASFGIRLLLDAEPDEYYGRLKRDGIGLSVMVHDQNTQPTSELDGFDIPTGFATNFILKRKEIIRQPAPYPSKCGEIKLQTRKTYSETSCFWEKHTIKSLDKCGCRILGMPAIVKFVTKLNKFIKEHLKPSSQMIRTSKVWLQPNEKDNKVLLDGKNHYMCVSIFRVDPILRISYVRNAYHSYSAYVSAHITFDPKECPPPCNTVKYDIKTSSLIYPSRDVLENAPDNIKSMYKSSNGTNISFHDWYRSRFAFVNIFFHSADTEVMREVPAYDFVDFAAGFGGNMGLFLGCSVLTLLEFIDILVVITFEWYRKKQRNVQTFSVKPR
ncbi:acid-sensing ion channel 4-like [Actinia tenebrosa]|uniref:Acid-sensing ion channel 4-like n=1 Tax=Actinia tenebrosa TaxID=6105 RepID=A0A6P8J142_ACTTE|nr:acid-sensing ion channel 4-like [Actinia tenebrosa]